MEVDRYEEQTEKLHLYLGGFPGGSTIQNWGRKIFSDNALNLSGTEKRPLILMLKINLLNFH